LAFPVALPCKLPPRISSGAGCQTIETSEAVTAERDDSRPVAFAGHGGVTIRGEAWGDPGARPVVLLHGGGQTRHSWSGAGRELARAGWRALALDLRGHGESDWDPDGAYLPDQFAADLCAVARSLPEPPVVVGASLGGMAALLAEGEERGVLAGVVLVDIAPRIEPRGVERIVSFMLAKPDGFESLDEAADAVASYRQNRGRPTDLSGLRKNLRHDPDGRWRWHWDPAFINRERLGSVERLRDRKTVGEFHNSDRMLKAARSLRVPVLLVRGRASDVVAEEGARELLDAVPHARYVDVSDAGHMVAGDRNDAFNAAVIEFLGEAFA